MSGAEMHAVVFAGGRGSRLGGADKAALELGGSALVDRAVAAAVAAGARSVVVVGPDRELPPGCITAREDPPFAGPLAALAAGIAALRAARDGSPDAEGCDADPGDVLLLACDLVRPAAVAALLASEPPAAGEDAVVLRDPDARMQWLAGRYRLASLVRALAAIDVVVDQPLRRAVRDLRVRALDAEAGVVADIDTPDDLARARAEAHH